MPPVKELRALPRSRPREATGRLPERIRKRILHEYEHAAELYSARWEEGQRAWHGGHHKGPRADKVACASTALLL